MSLIKEGFRFMVYPVPFEFRWVHPAEVTVYLSDGWVDTTEMTDDEYNAFVKSCE
jgi:hypothetical protein